MAFRVFELSAVHAAAARLNPAALFLAVQADQADRIEDREDTEDKQQHLCDIIVDECHGRIHAVNNEEHEIHDGDNDDGMFNQLKQSCFHFNTSPLESGNDFIDDNDEITAGAAIAGGMTDQFGAANHGSSGLKLNVTERISISGNRAEEMSWKLSRKTSSYSTADGKKSRPTLTAKAFL